MSYYLDYYTSQYTEGNFAQFVYNSIGTSVGIKWADRRRIDLLGAVKHLSTQQHNAKANLDEFGKREINFSKQKFEGVTINTDLMNSDILFSRNRSRNLVQLNAAFKSHPICSYFR
jgi:hypothetical protein